MQRIGSREEEGSGEESEGSKEKARKRSELVKGDPTNRTELACLGFRVHAVHAAARRSRKGCCLSCHTGRIGAACRTPRTQQQRPPGQRRGRPRICVVELAQAINEHISTSCRPAGSAAPAAPHAPSCESGQKRQRRGHPSAVHMRFSTAGMQLIDSAAAGTAPCPRPPTPFHSPRVCQSRLQRELLLDPCG